MPEKPEFVQIETGEDVSSIKDRLTFIRGKNVLLIWPEEGTALTRKLDLVLIQRESMRRAIRLALVTHDSEVIKNANELNISTFETIGASERSRWKRGRSKVFTSRKQRPDNEPEPETLMEVASRVRGTQIRGSRWFRLGLRLIVVLIFVGIVFAGIYIFVPTAIVTIIPNEQNIDSGDILIIADPSLQGIQVDVENGIIPTIRHRITIEDEVLTVNTTGTQSSDNVRATGVVTFINRTDNEVAIPIGTQVSTGTGTPVQFRTLEALTLDAGVGQEVDVAVEAMPNSAGAVGNVATSLVNTVVGPLESDVSVINRIPMTGGENLSVNIVTDEDRQSLLRLMRQQLQTRAFLEVQSNLTESQFIVDETIQIVSETDVTFSAEVGAETDTLTLTMDALIEIISVDERFAEQVVFAYMANEIARGRVILPESIAYERGVVTFDPATRTISFVMSGTGMVQGQIDSAFLEDSLAGQSEESAMNYLLTQVDYLDGTTPQIEISPNWFGRMPMLPFRITINVENDS